MKRNELPLRSRLAFALDVPIPEAYGQIEKIAGKVGWIKINSVFVEGGSRITNAISNMGTNIFLDLKWYDIPNSLGNYGSAASKLDGIKMINFHASGGSKMMKEIVGKLDAIYADNMGTRPLAIAVTVLTSMSKEDLEEIGVVNVTPAEQVLRLAKLAINSGCDGVVASPQESAMLREELGEDFIIVTPGIRFADGEANDQVRLATPRAAIAKGSDILVMGRPLISGGLEAIERAYNEIGQGLADRKAA